MAIPNQFSGWTVEYSSVHRFFVGPMERTAELYIVSQPIAFGLAGRRFNFAIVVAHPKNEWTSRCPLMSYQRADEALLQMLESLHMT